MLKRLCALVRVAFANMYELNEVRYGKDPKKKRRAILMLCAFIYIYIVLIINFFGVAYSYASGGMADIIPVYQTVMCSIATLIFSFLSAGRILFNERAYERSIVLPVGITEIVLSRFIAVYLTGFLFSLLAIIPSSAVYVIFVHPNFGFYIYTLIGLFLQPLVSLTVAVMFGALVLAVSARMKNKTMVSTVLQLVLMIGLLVVVYSGKGGFMISPDALSRISALYLPTKLYAQAINNGSLLSFLLFAIISLGLTAILLLIVRKWYAPICRALNATYFKGDYHMAEQAQTGVLHSLYAREMKRYFASSIYVLNTITGYIMMILASAALLIVGKDKLEGIMGVSGMLDTLAPFVIGLCAMISPPTSSSISMAGKSRWIIMSLPVNSKSVYDSKLLVSFTFALPAWVISCSLLTIALRPDALAGVFLWLLPLSYVLFSVVCGLAVNIRLPSFTWENEAQVVKQSSSVGICMLIGFVAAVVPAAAAMLIPSAYRPILFAVLVALLALLALVMYRSVCRRKLINIE